MNYIEVFKKLGAWNSKDDVENVIKNEDAKNDGDQESLKLQISQNYVQYSQILTAQARLQDLSQKVSFQQQDVTSINDQCVKHFQPIRDQFKICSEKLLQQQLEQDHHHLFSCIANLQNQNNFSNLNEQQIIYLTNLLQQSSALLKTTQDTKVGEQKQILQNLILDVKKQLLKSQNYLTFVENQNSSLFVQNSDQNYQFTYLENFPELLEIRYSLSRSQLNNHFIIYDQLLDKQIIVNEILNGHLLLKQTLNQLIKSFNDIQQIQCTRKDAFDFKPKNFSSYQDFLINYQQFEDFDKEDVNKSQFKQKQYNQFSQLEIQIRQVITFSKTNLKPCDSLLLESVFEQSQQDVFKEAGQNVLIAIQFNFNCYQKIQQKIINLFSQKNEKQFLQLVQQLQLCQFQLLMNEIKQLFFCNETKKVFIMSQLHINIIELINKCMNEIQEFDFNKQLQTKLQDFTTSLQNALIFAFGNSINMLVRDCCFSYFCYDEYQVNCKNDLVQQGNSYNNDNIKPNQLIINKYFNCSTNQQLKYLLYLNNQNNNQQNKSQSTLSFQLNTICETIDQFVSLIKKLNVSNNSKLETFIIEQFVNIFKYYQDSIYTRGIKIENNYRVIIQIQNDLYIMVNQLLIISCIKYNKELHIELNSNNINEETIVTYKTKSLQQIILNLQQKDVKFDKSPLQIEKFMHYIKLQNIHEKKQTEFIYESTNDYITNIESLNYQVNKQKNNFTSNQITGKQKSSSLNKQYSQANNIYSPSILNHKQQLPVTEPFYHKYLHNLIQVFIPISQQYIIYFENNILQEFYNQIDMLLSKIKQVKNLYIKNTKCDINNLFDFTQEYLNNTLIPQQKTNLEKLFLLSQINNFQSKLCQLYQNYIYNFIDQQIINSVLIDIKLKFSIKIKNVLQLQEVNEVQAFSILVVFGYLLNVLNFQFQNQLPNILVVIDGSVQKYDIGQRGNQKSIINLFQYFDQIFSGYILQ